MFSSNASQVSNNVKYIEDVFSTWLRTGTGSSTTITTGLDASTNKALVWTKSRSAATNHKLTDTVRGATKALISNTTGAQTTDTNGLTAFSSTGYTIGSDTNYNNSGATYVDWEFVATPKFFDVVTYTGNGTTQNISHSLGSTPGCVIVKNISSANAWQTWHRGLTAGNRIVLNTTAAQTSSAIANVFGNNTSYVAPTSTQFTVGDEGAVNQSGQTMVAYLFAHDAGGFGLTGSDNVISCASLNTDGSGKATVTLGYEPQWVMVKRSSGVGSWSLLDIMRGMPSGQDNAVLEANTSGAETLNNLVSPTATGFTFSSTASSTFIYVAIRRGPMKVPTDGTSVFTPAIRTGTGTTGVVVTNANFPIDLAIGRSRNAADAPVWIDRLRGATVELRSDNTDAQAASNIMSSLASQNGWIGSTSGSGGWNVSAANYIQWYMRRAPGFFDEVCYTGTGSALNLNHNLGVVPELMILKTRSVVAAWYVYNQTIGNTKYLSLNTTAASATFNVWNNTTPTSSVFSVSAAFSSVPETYVAYLFASCPGVSKVFSFTGNGSTQTINCGFTGGARFVLLKASSATGGWFVYDTARGMTVLTDPYLQLNTTAAEVATLGSVTTVSTGFAVNEAITTGVNTNGVTYIGLAIA